MSVVFFYLILDIEDAYGDAPPPPFALQHAWSLFIVGPHVLKIRYLKCTGGHGSIYECPFFLELLLFDGNAVVCFSLVPWGCLFAPVFSKVGAVLLTL